MDGSSVKFPKTPRKGGLIGWKYVGCAVIKMGFGGLYGGFVYWWVVIIGGATFVWHGLCFWNCREKNFLGGGGGRRFHNGIFFQRNWCWLCCLIKSWIGRIKIFLLEFSSKKFFGWWRWRRFFYKCFFLQRRWFLC